MKTKAESQRKGVIPRAPLWKRAKFLLAYWFIGKSVIDEEKRLKELIREVINEDKS